MKDLNFDEISNELLNNEKPSDYFINLLNEGLLDVSPFNELKKLNEIPQSPKHHPEGNVWNHVMLVLDNGAYYKKYANDKKAFMWALLLHDIGKIKTTKLRKGRWTSYNHDNVGALEGREFLNKIKVKDNRFIEKVENLIRYHMHFLYINKDLPFGNEEEMLKSVDLNDIALVFICDRLGRANIEDKDKDEVFKGINKFLKRYDYEEKVNFELNK